MSHEDMVRRRSRREGTDRRVASAAVATAGLLIWCAVAVLPGKAAGATRKIQPHHLIPTVSNQEDVKTSFVVASRDPVYPVSFYFPLKLPGGAIITGLRYKHAGLSNPAKTKVSIMRVRAAAAEPLQTIISGSSTSYSPTVFFETVRGQFLPGMTRRITPGWKYYLLVSCGKPFSGVGTVFVAYR